MSCSYRKTGVLTVEDLQTSGLLAPPERIDQGPVVVIECIQEIPCNPCVEACPRRAIRIDGGINAVPRVDFARCTGCTMCVARCPGLAIFVVNKHYNPQEAVISLPYEFWPRPRKGSIVYGLDRSGRKICRARVESVLDAESLDRCAIISVAVPKRYYNTVRAIRVMRKGK